MVEGSIPAGKWLELLGEAAEKARDGVGEALARRIGGGAARDGWGGGGPVSSASWCASERAWHRGQLDHESELAVRENSEESEPKNI